MQFSFTAKAATRVSVIALAFSVCMVGRTATTNVTYGFYFFDPKSVTIRAGDTVVWTNGTGSHTATGSGADVICGSASFLPCSHTFNTPGSFPYHCSEDSHALFG